MKIFALETDGEKARRQVVPDTERVLLEVYHHGFLFSLRFLVFAFYTALIMLAAALAIFVGLPWPIVTGAACLFWLFFILGKLIAAYVDWKFDTLIVTDQKVVISNQTSIFHVETRQMHLENIASVTCSTQMLNLFPFGRICFDLKEGTGQRICLKFIPRAAEVATQIAAIVTQYQQKRTVAVPAPVIQ